MVKSRKANYWINKLNMVEHPEGGYFVQTYRSPEQLAASSLPDRYNTPRHFGTAIYFLVTQERFSAFHRLKTDEIWHFYTGQPLALHIINPAGQYIQQMMGPDLAKHEHFQYVVPAGCWFAAEVSENGGYALVGCTLAPGFDFEDFELANRSELEQAYPQYAEMIHRFTRPRDFH